MQSHAWTPASAVYPSLPPAPASRCLQIASFGDAQIKGTPALTWHKIDPVIICRPHFGLLDAVKVTPFTKLAERYAILPGRNPPHLDRVCSRCYIQLLFNNALSRNFRRLGVTISSFGHGFCAMEVDSVYNKDPSRVHLLLPTIS